MLHALSSGVEERLASRAEGHTGPLAAERVWGKVAVSNPRECWLWGGWINSYGYGVLREAGRPLLAHRVAYESRVGTIPEGMYIDHVCHNPPCCNPAHLRAVTPKQNVENHSGPRKDNTSGVRGVGFHKASGLYTATVKHGGGVVYAKYFKTLEEAAIAVREARSRFHTHNDLDRVDI